MGRFCSLILGLVLLTGCAHHGELASQSDLPPPPEVPEDSPHRSAPNEKTKPVSADGPAEQAERRPQNILALSGGGAYGAFTAGVLNGWTKSNKRPEFDVVTGISTGALIAPMAFLGPKYDPELKHGYTEIHRRDVFAVRNWATIPFRDSVATSAPLRRMVEGSLTDEAIAEIAAEHRKGRRLYIGTTVLETRRAVVWDIGAIAARGGSDARRQVCDIIVASCSIPGVFPPVPITMLDADGKPKTEMHVDGGVTASVFVPPHVLESAAKWGKDLPGGGPANLYVIVSGKYYPGTMPVRPRLVKVLQASGGALLHAQCRRDLANLYHLCKLTGVTFNAIALRSDFPADDAGLDFDQKLMAQLYTEGVKVGYDGPAWDHTPPERGTGEPEEIRSGVRIKPGKP